MMVRLCRFGWREWKIGVADDGFRHLLGRCRKEKRETRRVRRSKRIENIEREDKN